DSMFDCGIEIPPSDRKWDIIEPARRCLPVFLAGFRTETGGKPDDSHSEVRCWINATFAASGSCEATSDEQSSPSRKAFLICVFLPSMANATRNLIMKPMLRKHRANIV